MNRSETKFNNTANKINRALFELIDKKPFQDISVSEICNKAGVNRSTFYSHYENTTELLHETHNNFMKEFFGNFEINVQEHDLSTIPVEDFITDKFIIPYLKFIKRHKKIHKIYVENSSIFQTDEFINQLIEKIWIPTCKEKGITDYKIIKYMSKYYLTGMTAIVNEWIKNNCKDDIILICEILILCARH